jgi:hypothetical protein
VLVPSRAWNGGPASPSAEQIPEQVVFLYQPRARTPAYFGFHLADRVLQGLSRSSL